jgi:hypothetical protein
VTNLPLTFTLDTTAQADGSHQLTAVAYEGSHVRTQRRVTQTVNIQNNAWSAALATLYGGANTDLGATLQFSVSANTNNISKIELFSTGGSLTNVANQSSAVFAVPATRLGIGLHPFYALVTDGNGKQYRTGTKWLRIIGAEPPFPVSLTTPPPTLAWPATAGRSYDVLASTNLANPFQPASTLVPSNSAAQWIDTNPPLPQRFYRVRTTN